jgi:hypothetical protein
MLFRWPWWGIESCVLNLQRDITELRRDLMAQFDDLKAALAEEDKDIDAVLALVASEVAKITDLQNQLAAALANAAPDLTAQIADIQAQTAKLAAVLPPPAPPTT